MVDHEISQDSLVTSAAQFIRKSLLSGELAMGERVREEALSRRLGISRPPVREALRLIHAEGLLEHVPRKGYRVTMLSDDAVREIVELRELLESKAIEIMSTNDEIPELSSLIAVIDQMEASAAENDVIRLISLVTDFHLAVVRLANKSRLYQYYRELMLQMQLWLASNAANEVTMDSSVQLFEQHRDLLEVLKKGDWKAALQAFSEHNSYDSLQRSAVNISSAL